MDSRFRGNDSEEGGGDKSGKIPAFAGMTVKRAGMTVKKAGVTV